MIIGSYSHVLQGHITEIPAAGLEIRRANSTMYDFRLPEPAARTVHKELLYINQML